MRWRFVHIPRTGGTSFSAVYGRGTEGRADEAHLPAREFPGVFTFAFIRDPVQRAVSLLGYILRVSCPLEVPKDVVRQWKSDGEPRMPARAFVHWADLGFPTRGVYAVKSSKMSFLTPQVEYLAEDTQLLRFDRLEEQTASIAAQLNLPPRKLPWMSRSLIRPATVDSRGRKIVERKWAADYEALEELWT